MKFKFNQNNKLSKYRKLIFKIFLFVCFFQWTANSFANEEKKLTEESNSKKNKKTAVFSASAAVLAPTDTDKNINNSKAEIPPTDLNANSEAEDNNENSDTNADSSADNSEDSELVTPEKLPPKGPLDRPWRAPFFNGQESALGYNKDFFQTPKGLEIPVQFWIDIYSKYTTDQGLIHDSVYVDLIYEILDFTAISMRANLNPFQKEKLKKKMIKDSKNRVKEILTKLSKMKEMPLLSDAEKKVWNYFVNLKKYDSEKTEFTSAQIKEISKEIKETLGRGRLRFQLGQRDRMVQAIYFSGRYLEDFEKVFKENNLPMELTRLVFVESSFNVLARSKVGASGLWQIMKYTMKPYQKKDPTIDLRNHPMVATETAAKILKFNYSLLQDWPLAITGYNHGPHGVLRITQKNKSRNIVEIIKNVSSKKRLGFASRNFYPSFLAALEVESKAPQYFGTLNWSQPLDAVEIPLSKPLLYKDLLTFFDNDDLKTQVFNPHITTVGRKNKQPIPKGIVISVPKYKLAEIQKNYVDKFDFTKINSNPTANPQN